MNKLTQDFHQANFRGIDIKVSFDQVKNNFWQSTYLPFVDTGIDFEVSTSYNWLLNHTEFFDKDSRTEYSQLVSKHNNTNWFQEPQAIEWYCCNVFGTNQVLDTHADATITRWHPTAFPDLQKQIDRLNLPISRLAVFKLEPGGYVQPHVDLRKGPNRGGLNHVWLPLHDFAQSLKIYPYGYVQHQTGRMYLLNNPHYVHSVVNYESIPRYVALMTIDYHNLDTVLENQIFESAKRQWFQTV
jgi:hypothetical protein